MNFSESKELTKRSMTATQRRDASEKRRRLRQPRHWQRCNGQPLCSSAAEPRGGRERRLAARQRQRQRGSVGRSRHLVARRRKVAAEAAAQWRGYRSIPRASAEGDEC